MGSQTIQSKLWGQRAKDWSNYQEPTAKSGYEYALHYLNPQPSQTILDIGCGSGLFISLAAKSGAQVTGFDATEPLLEEAKLRNPNLQFFSGEMEELPFDGDSFDIVCGFNSFQYAANVKGALLEAKRVLKQKGKLVAMIWGNKEDCEATTYLKAVGSLLPPPPPGAPGPFALTENHLLEHILEDIGFTFLNSADVDSIWDYPSEDIAMKGLLSAGPAARAIENAGYEKAYQTLLEDVKQHTNGNGHVIYKNKFRVVIVEK